MSPLPWMVDADHGLIDLRGRVFGQLTVSGRVFDRKRKRCAWACVCACGNIVFADGHMIRIGGYTSCGCARPELRLSEED